MLRMGPSLYCRGWHVVQQGLLYYLYILIIFVG